MSFAPFLTGSYAYGEPQHLSDIDIVAYLNPETNKLLKLAAFEPDCDLGTPSVVFQGYGTNGKLHLILVRSPAEYAAWKQATDVLVQKKISEARPIPKKEAAVLIEEYLKSHGVK